MINFLQSLRSWVAKTVVRWEKVPCKISLNQIKDYSGFSLRLQERKDVET